MRVKPSVKRLTLREFPAPTGRIIPDYGRQAARHTSIVHQAIECTTANLSSIKKCSGGRVRKPC
jgi:hypothetical protein